MPRASWPCSRRRRLVTRGLSSIWPRWSSSTAVPWARWGRVRAQARQAGGDLLLAAPRGPVRRILALTGLIDVFSVHASVEDAVRIIPPLLHLARAGQQFPAWPWGRYSCHGVDLPRAPCCRVRRFNPAFRPAWL